jgi:hypothetical protein
MSDLITSSPLKTKEEELLEKLYEARTVAWKIFDYHQRPDANNDWTKFAEANANWYKLYKNLYGQEPKPDEIDLISSRYYRWYRYEQKNKEQPPEYIWKGGERKEKKIDRLENNQSSFETEDEDYQLAD